MEENDVRLHVGCRVVSEVRDGGAEAALVENAEPQRAGDVRRDPRETEQPTRLRAEHAFPAQQGERGKERDEEAGFLVGEEGESDDGDGAGEEEETLGGTGVPQRTRLPHGAQRQQREQRLQVDSGVSVSRVNAVRGEVFRRDVVLYEVPRRERQLPEKLGRGDDVLYVYTIQSAVVQRIADGQQ